jgi:phosphoenolpyruvate carboxylase
MSYGVIVKEYGYPTYKDVAANTFDEFLDYVKANKDIWRVVVPMTNYSYGTTFVDSANLEWLEDHYPRAVKKMEFNATISRWKFLQSEELREIIAALAEDYPLIDDGYHSRIEAAAHWEFFEREASDLDDYLTAEQIDDCLRYVGSSYGEYVYTDSDGATVYMLEKEQDYIRALIADMSANQ